MGTFSGCKAVEKIIIPTSVVSIGNYCFENCSNLKEIVIPSTVTKIKESIFEGCYSLTKITVPNNVFNGSISLNQAIVFKRLGIHCSKVVLIADNYAEFKTIPNHVSGIGPFCFDNNPNVKELILPTTIDHIQNQTQHYESCCNIRFDSDLVTLQAL
jgi:hypothetical protein